MVENKVQEEVLYREGLAMGLDKDDDHRQAPDGAEDGVPRGGRGRRARADDGRVQGLVREECRRFALRPRVTFRHLYFSPDSRGTRAKEDAAEALPKLAGQPEDAKLAAVTGRSFHVPGLLPRSCAGLTSARSSARCSRWRRRSCRQDRGRDPSNPASAGTWCSSIRRFPARSRPSRRSSPTSRLRGSPNRRQRRGKRRTRTCARSTRCCCPRPPDEQTAARRAAAPEAEQVPTSSGEGGSDDARDWLPSPFCSRTCAGAHARWPHARKPTRRAPPTSRSRRRRPVSSACSGARPCWRACGCRSCCSCRRTSGI